MKRLILSTVLGVLALTATAQSQPEPSVRVPAYQIEVPAKPYRMSPEDFRTYKGGYELSNGETMTLRSVGKRMYADVSNRPSTEIVAARHNVFVARDRSLKMTLNEEPSGDITGEMLMVVHKRTAQAGRGAGPSIAMVTIK